MALNAAAFRVDKRCGKSGIPDNAKCTKQTSAKSAPSPELKERAFAAATAVQGVRAARSFVIGKKGSAVKQLLSAGKNASEYAQERGERTGNKRLLAFATGKNLVEAAKGARGAASAIKAGDWTSAAFNIGEVGNTALESYTFNRQRQGKKLAAWEEYNRNFGDLLQANKWVSAATRQTKQRRKPTMDSITAGDFRADACWKGYVQKGVKRKGNRTVPNCVPVGKAKAEVKSKTGQDGEDKLTSAKRTVWAEGFPAKKTKARR